MRPMQMIAMVAALATTFRFSQILEVGGLTFPLLHGDRPRPTTSTGRQMVIEIVSELLRTAGQRHHEAFAHVNGDDPEWPAWYATFLAPHLATLLQSPPPAEQLARDLSHFEAEREAHAPSADWPPFYAERLINRYGAR